MLYRFGSLPALFVLSVALAAAAGCKRSQPHAPEATAPPPAPGPVAEAPAAPVSAPAAPEAPPPSAAGPTLPPGWAEVSLADTLPICVFSSFEAREAAPPTPKIPKQTLKENAPVVFGVFPPWCLNTACDQRSLLQCWIERDGATLTVYTRYSGLRKEGATCTEDCTNVEAACETPLLEPGNYTIRHGGDTHTLKIPSVVRSPCFLRRDTDMKR